MERNNCFTCIGRGHGAPAIPATREEWEKMRREPWLKEMCRRVAAGDENLKHRMPIWTPHCAEFRGNHRAIADAVKPLPRLMMDFDEKGHTDEIMQKFINRRGILYVCPSNGKDTPDEHEDSGLDKLCPYMKILMVEESVRKGTHVLVELPEGMQADEAQRLMEEATGFKPDEAVKDVSRCIYMVSEEHTRFVSEELFDVSEECIVKSEEFPTGVPSSQPSTAAADSSLFTLHSSLHFKGIPYESIIAEWWSRNGGEPAEGERNVKLHRLAVNLRAICDNKKEVLMAVMPRLGLTDAELRSIVDSACKEEPKGISKSMQEIINDLSQNLRPMADGRGLVYLSPNDAEDGEDERAYMKYAPTINPRQLPLGLKESLAGVPKDMYWPVLCSVLPIAGAYADQVEVQYCDGNRQKLGLMSIILGDQASGKSVCKHTVDIWKRQFDEEDALARKREEEWKERKKARKANEKAPDDPKVLIRVLPVTVSCSTLLKRFKNAKDHTVYSFGEELDTLRKTNGAGSWSSKYDIYRLAFDQGEWGQDYNSDQAESGVVKVAYNWTMLGTYGAMKKCFKADNIENGLSSRILVAEMPDSSFSKMPKYGRRTAADEAKIQEAVTLLRKANGFVDTPRLRKAIEDWVEQKRIEAAKDIDRVKDTYRKRAAVIGFRAGVIFYLLEAHPQPLPKGGELEGKKNSLPLGKGRGWAESKRCIDFAISVAEYCLQKQISIFGEALQSQYVDAQSECQRYGANHSIFDQLPPTFTMDDLRALKRGYCTEKSLSMIISRWKRDGWIDKTDRRHWQKTQQSNITTK